MLNLSKSKKEGLNGQQRHHKQRTHQRDRA